MENLSTTHAVLLGILQGLGEFLPISSSAHLIVVPWILHWEEHPLAFDVALHVGTLAAVLYAFLWDWVRLLKSAARGAVKGNPFAEADGRLLGLVALASVPGAVAGLLLEKWADTVFRSPALIACTMALLGALLLLADNLKTGRRGLKDISVADALLIGVSQAAAIVPGVSRSGATITAALLLGCRREDAARFSFLMATPITLGAALVKVPGLLRSGAALGPLVLGMATAALFGFLSIRGLLAYVRTRSYAPFAYYRWAFAAVVAAILVLRR